MEISIFSGTERLRVEELTGDIRDLDIGSEECVFDGPVRVVCRLIRDDDIQRVEGEVTASLSMDCSRCLEPVPVEVTGAFAIVIKRLPAGAASKAEKDDADESEDDHIIYVGHYDTTFDIGDYVREAVILSLPLKVLCSEDCKGLCPSCGKNLNEGECGCSGMRSDGRWDTLTGIDE
jgi:uncharacterized protein